MNCPLQYQLLSIWLVIAFCLQPAFVSANLPGEVGSVAFFSGQLAFPTATVTNANTIHIPFKLAGRLIAVEARIDTLAGAFIIDTGAERLLLNQNYFTGRARPNLSAAVGNTGNAGPVIDRKVDSLHWDNMFFLDIQAHVLDLSHIERKKNMRIIGIIGQDVFADFELFLDFQLQQIILTRLDKNGNRLDPDAMWEMPYDSLGFKLCGHLIILEAEVGGNTLKFNLDSGAELNLIDRRVKRKVLDQFEIVKRVNMVGAGQRSIEVLAGTLSDVRCGNQYSESMRTLLTNLTHMNGSLGVRMDGVLGFEFLSTRRTLINYKRKKLFFFREQRP